MCSGSVRKVEAAAKGVAIDQRQWLQLRLQLQLEHHLLFPFSVHLKPKLWQKRCSDLRPKNWRPGARVSRYSDTDTDGARAAPPPPFRNTLTHRREDGGKAMRGWSWVLGKRWMYWHPAGVVLAAALLFKDL